MKPHTLACILVKLLGISMTVNGIVVLVSTVSNAIFCMSVLTETRFSTHNLGTYLSTALPGGLVHLAAGVYLLTQTSRVVEKLLRISPDSEKAQG